MIGVTVFLTSRNSVFKTRYLVNVAFWTWGRLISILVQFLLHKTSIYRVVNLFSIILVNLHEIKYPKYNWIKQEVIAGKAHHGGWRFFVRLIADVWHRLPKGFNKKRLSKSLKWVL
uniref:Uncharacterized protein n=1 Tax=Chromera velia TaxID=505693 RepID=D9IXD6_9ALVE|nr:hypothetical protein CHVEC_pgp034 [Chromera velia]ADJ66544.1 hypothetical protein [Chromera velia]